jgi:hypothetical protein
MWHLARRLPTSESGCQGHPGVRCSLVECRSYCLGSACARRTFQAARGAAAQGLKAEVDAVAVASATEAQQRERVLSRPGWSEAKLAAVRSLQVQAFKQAHRSCLYVDLRPSSCHGPSFCANRDALCASYWAARTHGCALLPVMPSGFAEQSLKAKRAPAHFGPQVPDAEKRARADFVIDTSTTLEATREAVTHLIERLSSPTSLRRKGDH